MSEIIQILQSLFPPYAGHEIRAFRASETTHFAAGQLNIILRVSVGQPIKNQKKIYQNMCIISVHVADYLVTICAF